VARRQGRFDFGILRDKGSLHLECVDRYRVGDTEFIQNNFCKLLCGKAALFPVNSQVTGYTENDAWKTPSAKDRDGMGFVPTRER
jgi:hypothetical protein